MDYTKEIKAYKHALYADIGKIVSKGYERTTPQDEAILERKLEIYDLLCDLIDNGYTDTPEIRQERR